MVDSALTLILTLTLTLTLTLALTLTLRRAKMPCSHGEEKEHASRREGTSIALKPEQHCLFSFTHLKFNVLSSGRCPSIGKVCRV